MIKIISQKNQKKKFFLVTEKFQNNDHFNISEAFKMTILAEMCILDTRMLTFFVPPSPLTNCDNLAISTAILLAAATISFS